MLLAAPMALLQVKPMKRYGNRHGGSGILAYELGPDSIEVKFVNGDLYRYTYKSAGRVKVERMKVLAESGRGLSTFISRHARDDYEH